jgi:UDP-N-acetylglucosamine--N-acetylmuramyl-(pentapeptide) pyrophosphoryl-undecaprenol N-acetylglucosamine transferase
MKILFCGGGTLGPVTPLLAIIEAWRKKDSTAEFIFVGTPHGPERELLAKEPIEFHCLPEAKLVRYPSVEWLYLPIRVMAALYVAWKILQKEKPALIVSAGGYTSVPLIIIGWFLKIPSFVHQQDVRPLLSNKLVAPFASLITVAWPELKKTFPKAKTIGNPVRSAFLRADKINAVKYFGLNENKPTILVLGGGTGSLWINKTISEIIDQLLTRTNLIHLTGKGKMVEQKITEGYRAFQLLTEEMPLALAAADLVVCRAGMATITELAATKKAAIIIPLPNSPQEDNAAAIDSASVVLRQDQTNSQKILEVIIELLENGDKRKELGEKINRILKTDVAEEMVEAAMGLVK